MAPQYAKDIKLKVWGATLTKKLGNGNMSIWGICNSILLHLLSGSEELILSYPVYHPPIVMTCLPVRLVTVGRFTSFMRSSRPFSAVNELFSSPVFFNLHTIVHLTMSNFSHFATNAIHVGQDPEQWKCHAVVPPIFLSTTFEQEGPAATYVRFHGLFNVMYCLLYRNIFFF